MSDEMMKRGLAYEMLDEAGRIRQGVYAPTRAECSLRYECALATAPGRAIRTGYLYLRSPQTLAGHRFLSVRISGVLQADDYTLQQMREWLHHISGTVQLGNVDNSQGNVRVSKLEAPGTMEIDALLCGYKDCESLLEQLRAHKLSSIEEGVPSPEVVPAIVPTVVPAVAPSESKLVQHARREMKLIGAYHADVDYGGSVACNVQDVIALIASQGHSGGSMEQFLLMFDKLIRREPLSRLTDDPAEWVDMFQYDPHNPNGPTRYQNLRDSSAFSSDGGKRYWKLSDDAIRERVYYKPRHVEPTGPHPTEH